MKKEHILKERLSYAIKTLGYYEKGFSSTKRTPIDELRERSESLAQYIECRLNFECFKIPELREYEEKFDGFLFKISLTEENGRKFETGYITLGLPKIILPPEVVGRLRSEVSSIIGGSKLKFNNSFRKLKIEPVIEDLENEQLNIENDENISL